MEVFVILRIDALVSTSDSSLGADDGLVDEVVSEDSVHNNLSFCALGTQRWSQPLFLRVLCSPVLYGLIISRHVNYRSFYWHT